jgi:hypothetical protein
VEEAALREPDVAKVEVVTVSSGKPFDMSKVA